MKSLSRRSFLRATGGSAIAFPFIGWKSTASGEAPSKDIRVAAFGANGRAWGDISGTMKHKYTTLVAAAEVDEKRTGNVKKDFPGAKVYSDYRELLDKHGKEIDVAVVGTPDHMHAPIAMSAMQLGKHVYCEKPMTRTLHECRTLTEYAAANKLITQMGNQLASGSGNKTTALAIQSGVIGKVVAVHSMCPKSWGSSTPLGAPSDPPAGLNWEHWIGVAKMRSYVKGEFHPGQWRKRIGYGTGTLGDMACHIVHPWYKGLGGPAVLEVKSTGAIPVDGDSWPLNCKVEHVIRGNDLTDGDFPYTWYDGSEKPSEKLAELVGGATNIPKMGTLIIGTKGVIAVAHGGSSMPTVYRNGQKVDESLEKPVSKDHHGEWLDAVRGSGVTPVCDFSYAGPMTELVLMGTVAIRVPGKKLKWNSEKLRFTNSKEASAMVREKYREGWEVKGL